MTSLHFENDTPQDYKTQPNWLPRTYYCIRRTIIQIIASDVLCVLNFKIGHTHLQKHCIYNDNFTVVTATKKWIR